MEGNIERDRLSHSNNNKNCKKWGHMFRSDKGAWCGKITAPMEMHGIM